MARSQKVRILAVPSGKHRTATMEDIQAKIGNQSKLLREAIRDASEALNRIEQHQKKLERYERELRQSQSGMRPT